MRRWPVCAELRLIVATLLMMCSPVVNWHARHGCWGCSLELHRRC